MTPPDALSKDARALLRAARGGDDVPVAERQRLLEAFQRRADAEERAPALRLPWLARDSRTGERSRLLRGPAKHIAWALAALVSTGSLAALAQQGAFQRLEAVIERVLGTPASEPSTGALKRTRPAQAAATPSAPAAADAAPAPAPQQAAPILEEDTPSVKSGVETGRAQSSASTVRSVAPVPSRSSGHAAVLERAPKRTAAPSDPVLHRDATPGDSIATEELDLIVVARNALAERRHAAARAAAERHAREFAQGAFSEERDAILALCDCREGASTERGRAFVTRRPDSLFAERIRQDCGLGANLVPGGSPAATHRESPPMPGSPH